MWLYLLELLSSQSERAWFRRSIINSLTMLLRMPYLISLDSISLSSTQCMLWSLPCFRGHKQKDLALDEAAANLALTYIVRAEVMDGKDSIALETISQSDLWRGKFRRVLTSLMRTRRGRIMVWVLTTPGMILSSGEAASETQIDDHKRIQSTSPGKCAPFKSSAQLVTLSQLFCVDNDEAGTSSDHFPLLSL